MKNCTVDNFDNEVLAQELPVFVDFYADWCGPCKMMGPIIEELEGDYEGKVAFCKVNIDDNMEIAEKYRIMSIPTMMIFKGGESVSAIIGACSKAELAAKIDAVI